MEFEIKNNNDCQAEMKRILKMVTPTSKVHQDYLNDTETFLNGHNSFTSLVKGNPKAKELPIKKFKIVESQIFKRKYLVAYANDNWFSTTAPKCDAVATPSIQSFGFNSPPLVIIPESKSRQKNNYFLSILEHEFVHVNQAILDIFPSASNFSKKPIPTLLNFTLSEYQAYFLQYYYFPASFEQAEKLGLTMPMENLSIFRGYTQSLETLVHAIYQGELSPLEVDKMLKAFSRQLPAGFKKIGLHRSYGMQYVMNLPEYLAIAVGQLSYFPAQPKNEGFSALNRWISVNLNL
jgi:hypothetical protein